MSRTRRAVLVGVGLVTAVAGVAFTLWPGLGPGGWLPTLFALGVWGVAVVGGAAAVLARLTDRTTDTGALPRAGERPSYPVPGDALARRVTAVGAGSQDAGERARIRERVRRVAVATLVRVEGLTPGEAGRRLTDGTWTDASGATKLFDRARHDHVDPVFERNLARFAGAVAALADDSLSPRSDGGDGSEDRAIAATDTVRQPASPGDPVTDDLDPGEERPERTGRWHGIQALALVAAAAGVLLGAPLVVLTGLAGVGFAAYSRLWTAPSPSLAVERSVSDPDPRPGDRVRVTLSIRNDGDRLIPDLRVCDAVPAGLRVVDGTPRHTTALRPGKTATIAYAVEAVRGGHEFEGVTVVTRDLSGASRRLTHLADPVTEVTCRPAYGAGTVSLGDIATPLFGRESVDATGSGVEFHSLREYRRGDPLGSVDWSQFAKTGKLAARRYDEPRTVDVVLLVDARRAAYVTDEEGGRPAVDACVRAAGALATGLTEDGDRVGVTALGSADSWVPPGGGGSHRQRLLDALTTHDAFDWDPPEGRGRPAVRRVSGEDSGATDRTDAAGSATTDPVGSGSASHERVAADGGTDEGAREGSGTATADLDDDAVRESVRTALGPLRSRLPSSARVLFLTPLPDAVAPRAARRLAAHGHDVAVASPDLTATDGPTRRLAAVERRLRVDRVRRQGIPVHEWTPPTDPTTDPGWAPCR